MGKKGRGGSGREDEKVKKDTRRARVRVEW